MTVGDIYKLLLKFERPLGLIHMEYPKRYELAQIMYKNPEHGMWDKLNKIIDKRNLK